MQETGEVGLPGADLEVEIVWAIAQCRERLQGDTEDEEEDAHAL